MWMSVSVSSRFFAVPVRRAMRIWAVREPPLQGRGDAEPVWTGALWGRGYTPSRSRASFPAHTPVIPAEAGIPPMAHGLCPASRNEPPHASVMVFAYGLRREPADA